MCRNWHRGHTSPSPVFWLGTLAFALLATVTLEVPCLPASPADPFPLLIDAWRPRLSWPGARRCSHRPQLHGNRATVPRAGPMCPLTRLVVKLPPPRSLCLFGDHYCVFEVCRVPEHNLGADVFLQASDKLVKGLLLGDIRAAEKCTLKRGGVSHYASGLGAVRERVACPSVVVFRPERGEQLGPECRPSLDLEVCRSRILNPEPQCGILREQECRLGQLLLVRRNIDSREIQLHLIEKCLDLRTNGTIELLGLLDFSSTTRWSTWRICRQCRHLLRQLANLRS